MLSQQEIFNKVKTHLISQGKRSTETFGKSERCMYRGPDGLKCAVGILIPDDKYSYEIESIAIRDLICQQRLGYPAGTNERILKLENVLIESGISKSDFGLLIDLQRIHDSGHPDYWEIQLNQLAIDWNISP